MPRILLVNPSNKNEILARPRLLSVPPLNLHVIKGLTPPEFEVDIVDENVGHVADATGYDLVGFTAMTSTVARAYELSMKFRAQGVPTIIGGVHVSMLPEEAMKYCTSVVTREAEHLWADILKDFQAGQLKPRYDGDLADVRATPTVYNGSPDYRIGGSIQTARGCPLNCDFCSVTQFNGGKYRARPIDQVIKDLEKYDGKTILFVDDNVIGQGRAAARRALELFKAIVASGIKVKWASQSTINLGDDDEILEWAHRAGARGFFIGLESISPAALKGMRKLLNLRATTSGLREKIKRIRSHGLVVGAGFIFGNDSDTKETFEETANFVLDSGIDATQYTISTPLPGTALYERLDKENRILKRNYPTDWQHYSVFECVFQPQNFSPAELEERVRGIYRDTNSFWPAAKRAVGTLRYTRDLEAMGLAFGFDYTYDLGFRKLHEQLESAAPQPVSLAA